MKDKESRPEIPKPDRFLMTPKPPMGSVLSDDDPHTRARLGFSTSESVISARNTCVRMFCSSVSFPSAVPACRVSSARRLRLRPVNSTVRSTVAMAGDASPSVFVGMWRREGTLSVGAVEYLQAHGLTPEKAAERAVAPYQQEWRETGEEEGEFLVLTDPGTGRGVRSLVYPIGEWEEPFEGNSELFGKEAGYVFRNTSFEDVGDVGWVHLTESVTPMGWETTQRRLDCDEVMVVERTFTPKLEDGSAGTKISSKEMFNRMKVFKPF